MENVSHASPPGMLAAVTAVGSRDGRAEPELHVSCGFFYVQCLPPPLGVGSVPKVLEKMA